MDGSILATGGAGYIGSHTVQQLAGRGESEVVLDKPRWMTWTAQSRAP